MTLRGVALEGILETTARLVNTGSSVDLETQLNAVTLYLRFPLPSVEVGDIILLNSGATPEELPTSFSTTGRLHVEGFQELGGTVFQAIQCVKIPDS